MGGEWLGLVSVHDFGRNALDIPTYDVSTKTLTFRQPASTRPPTPTPTPGVLPTWRPRRPAAAPREARGAHASQLRSNGWDTLQATAALDTIRTFRSQQRESVLARASPLPLTLVPLTALIPLYSLAHAFSTPAADDAAFPFPSMHQTRTMPTSVLSPTPATLPSGSRSLVSGRLHNA